MNNKLVSQLTELTSVDTANDKVPISDASDSSELKYILPSNLIPDASTTVEGKVELATTAETETGTDATRAVTPDGLHDMTTLAGAAWLKDEDNMASDSATTVPSQQSVKAYTDNSIASQTSKTYITPIIKSWTGWNTVSDTWTYASATTITVPSGAASLYQKGDKFKLTANSVVLYGYIVTVADTLLTVKGDSLTNHAFSSIAYSHVDNPIGFPQSFAYTPTGPTNTTLSGKFSITGGKCFVTIAGSLTGIPVWTNMPTLPIAVSSSYYANGADSSPAGVGGYVDNGTANKIDGITPSLQSSDTTVRLVSTANSGIVSTTNPITWASGDTWIVRLNYEI